MKIKIAFIHSEKRIYTGAHYINSLIFNKLEAKGVEVKAFYPRTQLIESPAHLVGLGSTLFFYSLLEMRREILKYDLIQGTTFTPLPFLTFNKPVIAHFGSSNWGLLNSSPRTFYLDEETKAIFYELRERKVINRINLITKRGVRDIAEIETYVASRAKSVIATSQKVRQDLSVKGVNPEKIEVIHNSIEDFWFENPPEHINGKPAIVFLGRIGRNSFDFKVKGVDRLIDLYRRFPAVEKHSFCMTTNERLVEFLANAENFPHHTLQSNQTKSEILGALKKIPGGIVFLPSRYEGFSLSLVEAMSQGCVPVTYPVGVATEIIQNGYNGYIVHNQQETERAVGDLIENTALRKKLSQNAYYTSLQFRSDIMISRFVALYERLLN